MDDARRYPNQPPGVFRKQKYARTLEKPRRKRFALFRKRENSAASACSCEAKRSGARIYWKRGLQPSASLWPFATTNQVILACPGIYSARCMCQAFGRRDASQKRRRRRYAEANTAKGPVPGIIFGRERKDPLRLSSLLLLIRRNPKRRDLSATEGTRTTIRRRGTKSHRAPAEAKCWIFLIASDREPAVVAFEGSSMKDYSSAMDNFDRGNRGALSLSTMPDGSTERGLRRMSTLWDL